MQTIARLTTALILSCLLVLPAQANDIAGWWTSSSGNRVNIWINMQSVVMTFHGPNGQIKVNGRWTRFGDYFTYTNNGVQYNAKVINRNQIVVQSARGTFTWNRGVAAAAPQPQPQAPPSTSGGSMWASTSGSTVQLSSQGHQVFVTIIGQSGKRFQGSGRWLQYPKSFDYSLPGYPGTAVCTFVNNSQIHVNYNGKVTYWNRRN